jgi:signal transduction histidine kinase
MPSHALHISAWTAGLENHKPFYMAVIDEQTRLSFVNTHFFTTFQQLAMQAQEKVFDALVDDQDLDRFKAVLKDTFLERRFAAIEVRMKNGTGKRVRWELRRLESDDVGPVKLFCLGYDLPSTGDTIGIKKHLLTDHLQHKKLAESIIRAQQEERARIGHELHDNVNQILGSAQLYLSLLNTVGEDVGFIRDKATELVLLAIEEIRNLSKAMVMPDFSGDGLVGTITGMVEELRYGKVFAIVFRHTDRLTIEAQDPCMKLALYRIVQEQTRNIVKHSQARNVEISLDCTCDQLRLLISDDGKGFDRAKTRRGVGLNGIYERAALFNGKAQLRTVPGNGCTLIITIPLELKLLV